MLIEVRRAQALRRKTPCLLVGVPEGTLRTPLLLQIDQAAGGALTRARRCGEFTGKPRQQLLLAGLNDLAPERVLLVGLGKARDYTPQVLRQALGAAVEGVAGRRLSQLTLAADSFQGTLASETLGQIVAEALLLADYRFDGFVTQGRDQLPARLEQVQLLLDRAPQVAPVATGVETGKKICRGVILARDLVNQPGNVKSPEYLAGQARQLAQELGLTCTVLEREALEKEGCGGILGVGQGSVREPRLVLLEYRGGAEAQKPVALVGKGVVFDSGGISIKPSEKMDQMKMDMGGAAAVLGTLCAAALLELPVNLVGIVPTVENMPSGTAYRPGDILTSLSGKTVEVLNTDAEGRLILADALTWAGRYQPDVVIDLATLTGACIIALGHQASAVLGNDDRLIRALIKAGTSSGERLWQLPLFPEYAEQIKSPVADVANVGGRPAGTITAAAFLQKFADDYTWAHLDIAGTAWEEKGRPCQPKGGTGVGVRLLVEYLRQRH